MVLLGHDLCICGGAYRVRRISRFTGLCGHFNRTSPTASSTSPTDTVDHKRECDATQ